MLYTFHNNQYPIYTPKKKFGFLKRIPHDMKNFPEFYGGFISDCDTLLPNIFIADCSSGIYSLSIKLRGNCHIFAQKRRLCAIYDSSEENTIQFSITVGDVIAGYDKKRYSNNRIILSFCGNAEIMSIQINSTVLPVVWLAGDSTVTDQGSTCPYEPGTSYCGWGQMLSLFLSPMYALYNLAHSGLTTDTFRSEGYYSIMYERLRPGDYVFIQFGHNDQKLPSLQARGRYYENLIQYIKEIKEKNAIPILVTPLARNTWNCTTNTYNDLLYEYAQAVIGAASYSHTSYIDLHKISLNHFMDIGLERSKPFFYPGDYTHTNDYGGFFIANLIKQEVMERSDLLMLRTLFSNHSPLSAFMPKKSKGWLSSPAPASPNSNKSGKFTISEALQYVQRAYKYFVINPLTNEPEEILAAKQNGYYMEQFENIDSLILWSDWVELLFLACSGRYQVVMKPEFTFPNDIYADWYNAIKYAQLLEEETTGCISSKHKINILVEGS